MQNRKVFLNIAMIFLCLHFMHCAITRAPRGWLVEPDQVPKNVYGAWVNIETGHRHFGGELIAVAKDSVFVVDTLLHAIASSDILSARLEIYAVGDLMPLGVLAGTILTISNGGFLIFTAPMWLLGGSIAASSRPYEPIIDYPDKALKEFAPYARYPQGLPTVLDRRAIRMKQRSEVTGF